jgi:hypothetical protein
MVALANEGGEGEYIFTKKITLRNGRVLLAPMFGLKAFRIRVKRGRRKPKPDQPKDGQPE